VAIDTGLVAMGMYCAFSASQADPGNPAQFRRLPLGIAEILRCAKQFQVKARAITTTWQRLAATPPAPGHRGSARGRLLVLARRLTTIPSSSRRNRRTVFHDQRAEFEAVLGSGRLVLMTRALRYDLARRFRHHLVFRRDLSRPQAFSPMFWCPRSSAISRW